MQFALLLSSLPHVDDARAQYNVMVSHRTHTPLAARLVAALRKALAAFTR